MVDIPRRAPGWFADLPGLAAPLRYAYVWPEVHAGLRYTRIMVLDGRGRRMLASGDTPLTVDDPEGALVPGRPPIQLPVPDLLVFTGHEWEPELRRESLLEAGAVREGLNGDTALRTHERRKFVRSARAVRKAWIE